MGVDWNNPHFAENFSELAALAKAANLNCLEAISAKRATPDAATFIGSGKC